MMIKIRIEDGRGNFHNVGAIRIKVADVFEIDGELAANVSRYQARRIRRHFCGISGCVCGSGPEIWDLPDGHILLLSPEWVGGGIH